MRVLMLNEGTYPYYKGGVSTWTHSLISGLGDFEYLVLTLTTKPPLKPLYPKPPNVQSFVSIPLWGTEYVGEHLPDFTVRWLMKLSRATSDGEVKEKFVPVFREFIREVKRGGRNPEAAGEALAEMRRFLANHSFKKTFRSGHVWKVFLEELEADELYSNMRIAYVLKIGSIMRNLLKTLAYRYPDANLIHSSAAGICGLIGVVKKIEDETPYVITEHGIYYRERLLDVSHRELNLPEKVFWLNFYKVITLVNYYYADRILPVCEFNVRWESRFGIPRSKIEVIYNGVDVERFRPMEVEVGENPPIVVMSRIEKLKDILNMISTMKYIKERSPKTVCEIYGPIVDEKYFHLCLRKAYELNVLDRVEFMGATDKPEQAYNRASVVVQPSLSEGFPYSVIEAMACGKPVVATDVGGVKEALGDAGIVVPPRSPKELADAILRILEDGELRRRLGERGRERVLKLFTYRRFLEEYRRLYLEIASESYCRAG